MLRYKWLIYVFGAFILASCSGDFTAREVRLIHEGEGVMRVWKIDKRLDSLFLRKKANLLDAESVGCRTFRKLKERMLLTVNDSTGPGVGIAAPQIGIGKAVIAVQRFDKPGKPFEFYINPVIESYSGTKIYGPEGCLSIPDLIDSVWRSDEITISYLPDPTVEESADNEVNRNFVRGAERRSEKVKGFTAVIFQHETDHLNGILFIDRIK